MNNKKMLNSEEFSEENKNLEVISSGEEVAHNLPAKNDSDEAIELTNGKLDVHKGGNIVIGTLNVMVEPVKKHLKKRHELFYKNSKFHLWSDIIFALIILGLAATFIIIFNLQPKAQIDLAASLADESAVSGQAETVTIVYKNNGKVSINNSTLSFNFPKNFVLLTVNPEKDWSDQTNTFKIGDLPRGANGEVEITGIFYGSVGSQQTLNYSFNYLQNNQPRNILGSYIISLESSVLEVSFDAPETIYKNVDFGGNIILKNNGRADIEKEIDLAFANMPIKIKSISSDKALFSNGEIIVNGLKVGETINIEYEAVVNASAGGLEAVLSAYFNIDGRKDKQVEVMKKLSVSAPKFSVNISADKAVMNSGETVNFKLNFGNQENSEINNVLINIMPSDSAVILKSFTLKEVADKYRVSGDSVAIGTLKAGGSGEIDFSTVLSRKADNINQEAGIVANVNYQVGGRQVEYKIFSPKIKFLSDLQVGSKGLYYSAQGDQLGVGPLPPVVDVPTHYWIFWEANNSGNNLKNLTITADLPVNVGWVNQKTVLAGDLRYGEISHKVIWTVDDVAAAGGNYRAGFEIELIPGAADLGKIPNLITNIKYSATDTFAKQNIAGSLPIITADLKDDPLASGKGKVVEMKIVK